MTVTETRSERAELIHAINAIQSEWSPRERTRRHFLAELRQRRLMRMLSPHQRREAYDCQCDLADRFASADADADADEPANARRSRCFVLIED